MTSISIGRPVGGWPMIEIAETARSLFAARSIRRRWEAGHDLITIHEDAATTDPSLREVVDKVLARRRAGIARLAGLLAHHLSLGLDVSRAAAVLDALTLSELYRELVEVQGWTPDEYEAWLAATLRQQLLGR